MFLFYPPKCLFCRRILLSDKETIICSICLHHLEEQSQALHQLSASSLNVSLLSDDVSPSILYLAPYSQCRYAIQRWKYHGNRCYAKKFAQLMIHQINFSQFDDPLFVPIPISPNRMKERGFNHAYDLANWLSKLTHIPMCDCLKRTRNTKKQASMTSSIERHQNIKNCMTLVKDNVRSLLFPVRSLLLVDDIYTTGSTMYEAMRLLLQEAYFKDATITFVVVSTNHILPSR